MTAHLPPSLLALFAPRPSPVFFPPPEKQPLPPYTGIADYVQFFEDPSTKPEEPPSYPFDTKKKRKERRIREKLKKHDEVIEDLAKSWNPHEDSKATTDPYKTLFVSRINYNTSEHKLKREFEIYGPIKKIRAVTDQNGKPRGYAFIEYEKERDMRTAYKQADGKKIDGRRVIVDVERGRTVRNWRPRRLGGGLGGTRLSRTDLLGPSGNRESLGGRGDERRDHGSRDRERERDRDREHGSRDRERDRDRGDRDRERGHSRDKEKDRSRHHSDKSRDRKDSNVFVGSSHRKH